MSDSTERVCVQCGRSFRGATKQCMACRTFERECSKCGREFRGDRKTCTSCSSVVRECMGCGKSFRDRYVRCRECRSAERECVACGKAFMGPRGTNKCGMCYATEHECVKCGRVFRGNANTCPGCYVTARECVKCGKGFTGSRLTCHVCLWFERDPEERATRSRGYRNSRRARLVAAEVAGPVSAKAYRAVLASGPCVYCAARATDVDHVRPLAAGGWEHVSNLVPACKSCNSSKGPRLLTEWRRGDRVAHGVEHSPVVAAEWRRLTDGVGLADLDDDGAELLPVV